jgi:hypothetical protein
VVLNLVVDLVLRAGSIRACGRPGDAAAIARAGARVAPAAPSRSAWGEAWRRLRKNRMAVACLLGLFAAIAVVRACGGPVVCGPGSGVDATTLDLDRRVGSRRPGRAPARHRHPRPRPAGAGDGRRPDRARWSGSSPPLVALVVGVAWGAVAGYAGGRVDYGDDAGGRRAVRLPDDRCS